MMGVSTAPCRARAVAVAEEEAREHSSRVKLLLGEAGDSGASHQAARIRDAVEAVVSVVAESAEDRWIRAIAGVWEVEIAGVRHASEHLDAPKKNSELD